MKRKSSPFFRRSTPSLIDGAVQLNDQQLRQQAAVFLDSVDAPRAQLLQALQSYRGEVVAERRDALNATT